MPGPHDFAVRGCIVRPARRRIAHRFENPPCDHMRARRRRVHRIPHHVRDDRDTPLARAGRGRYKSDLGQTRSNIFLQPGLDRVSLICPSGAVIPGRAEREPGIQNHRWLLSTARRPQLRATSTFVVMDSGPAPRSASRNDRGSVVARMEPPGHAFGVPKDKLRVIRELPCGWDDLPLKKWTGSSCV
jgi:hypothetical protein